MGTVLKQLTLLIARIHDLISAGMYALIPGMNDKLLHFLVIGIVGILAVLITYPLFRLMARKGLYFAISFVYVFSMLTGLTLAIEIGQKLTGTGEMEFADVAAGLMGFFIMFCLMVVIIYTIKIISDSRKSRISSTEGNENE